MWRTYVRDGSGALRASVFLPGVVIQTRERQLGGTVWHSILNWAEWVMQEENSACRLSPLRWLSTHGLAVLFGGRTAEAAGL